MKRKFKKVWWWWVLAVAVVLLLVMFLRGDEDSWVKESNGRWVKHGNPSGLAPLDENVKNFDDCARLYPVLGTYPEQCLAPDGRRFIRN